MNPGLVSGGGGSDAVVYVYDTTLRDGAQMEGISFSVEDKVKIFHALDALGVDYIEGGWPGSNRKDEAFFRDAARIRPRKARLAAFGSTCRVGRRAEEDPGLAALLAAETPVVTIVGKASLRHVTDVLRTDAEESLRMIRDSVAFLARAGREVIFDAEHFYDGHRSDPAYALAAIEAARAAGAATIVLCDTNGGTLTGEFLEVTAGVLRRLGGTIGVHVHNDGGVAVANSVEAARIGVRHIQGTFNGLGERCGNADLTTILPNLVLKLGAPLTIGREDLAHLTHVSRYVATIANHHYPESSPYVGGMAFAHKGGLHVDSIVKRKDTYEHIDPSAVGNARRVLLSDQAGRASVEYFAREEGIDLSSHPEASREAVAEIKRLEGEGYQFEGAEASAALILRRVLGETSILFDLVGFRVIVEKRTMNGAPISEATVKVRVGGRDVLCAGEGSGPVGALDDALRRALSEFYPEVRDIRLTDYRVRVIDEDAGTSAKVRVVIDSADADATWATVGASENIIEASWKALVDSIVYGLTRRGACAPSEAADTAQ
ncbi:MAG: citramalate synthase [Planctomycetes bacterium]|nr:citramalate synthase [Planctomycetota bacterium]